MTTEQKHTKGPWSASPCENGKEWGVDSGEWGIATCADYPGDGTPKANARRIVACVNACEDIPTDHLENFGLPPFAEKRSVLREENDALAAKVKELDGCVLLLQAIMKARSEAAIEIIKEITAQRDDAQHQAAFHKALTKDLTGHLQFIERAANHHGQKLTAQETLSIIQHYPPIKAITKGYADGAVPETENPYQRIEKLTENTEKLLYRASELESKLSTVTAQLDEFVKVSKSLLYALSVGAKSRNYQAELQELIAKIEAEKENAV